jgi:hypothetical protein
MDGKRKSEGEHPSQSEVKRQVDLPKPEEDGPYWLYLIRKYHPELETASKNRYRNEGGYWYCDDGLGDGFTEEERDADLLPTWKDQFIRREYILKRLRDTNQKLIPEYWCPSDYNPKPLELYDFIVMVIRALYPV